MERFIDAGQVAEVVGVSRDTVLAWFRDGVIPGTKLGHRIVRFSLPQVMAALELHHHADHRIPETEI